MSVESAAQETARLQASQAEHPDSVDILSVLERVPNRQELKFPRVTTLIREEEQAAEFIANTIRAAGGRAGVIPPVPESAQ